MMSRTDQFIHVDEVFGGIKPQRHYQNLVTGKSNIESATAAWYELTAIKLMYHPEYASELFSWHQKVIDLLGRLNEKNKHINIFMQFN